MELVLERVQPAYAGPALIARVDAKRSPELTHRYRITCLPTTLIIERGHVVRRFLGTAMAWEIEEALRELLPNGGAPTAPTPDLEEDIRK